MTGVLGAWATAFLAGAAFGAAYLGILWSSVKVLSRRWGVGLFVSLALLRALLAAGALATAFTLGAGADDIVAAVVGLAAVRVAASRRTYPARGGEEPWE